jgi:predicted phage tail protein|tara:strand:- start:7024 stop:7656 length:633 start_codon:yes stop_codon:yes gene_type:complete
MLKQVTLYGELAENYGRSWSLAVNSPSEAMQALAANNSGFRQFVSTSHERGVGYKVMVGKTYLENNDEIYDPSGKQEIKIVPVVLGAKKGGLGAVILGIGLMVAAPWLVTTIGAMGTALGPVASGLAGTTTTGLATTVGGMAMNMGASLVMGGIAQLLAPTPKPAAEEIENYSFNGVLNTTKQGVAIPICYGQLMVGGAVISAGMKAEDY